MKESELSVDVGALQQDAEYFAKRQLKKGAVGWLLLVLMQRYINATMTVAIKSPPQPPCASPKFQPAKSPEMSEMSTMLPTAGGGYSFARVAFGPFGGYLTGTAIFTCTFKMNAHKN
jgi:ethanolamine permease